MSPLAKKKFKFDYTWVIVACCFLTIATSLGFCSSTKQLFLKPVTDALNVSRDVYSLNTTFRYAAAALLNLCFGTLISKLRIRWMLLIGFVALVASNVMYALAENVILIYAGGVLLGIGLAFLGSTTISYIIQARCPNNTGTVLGFVLAANGFGGAIAIKVLDPIIGKSVFGFRNAYWLIALSLAIVGAMVVILYREKPGYTPPAKKAKKARGNAWEGFTFAEARKRKYFIPTAICLFLTGFVLAGINGISLTHMKESVGEAKESFITNAWAFHSLALMVSKFITGFLYDKKGLRFCFLICQGTAVIVMIALALVNSSTFGLSMAVVYAIGSSLALPLETVGVSLAVGDIFGTRDYAKILGLMTALVQVGFATGEPLMNRLYVIFGNYKPAIIVGTVAIALVSISFQIIIAVAHKDRKKVLTQRAAAAEAATVEA